MSKIINYQDLGKLSKSWRLKNQKIALATGVFDLLHDGHRQFLQAAKAEGDLLLIGVESDKRVKQLKGQNRPIEKINTRIKRLAQVLAVDKVFALPNDFGNKQVRSNLINQIKPDTLAVSAHTPFLDQKKMMMIQVGGQVKVVIKQFKNISTTKLLTSELKSVK